MKRILLNATQTEETRVAIVDGQYLYDLDIESIAQNKRKSNIYKGTVTRVEASLEAAFIDYGADRHGFLPLKEIARSLFPEGTGKRTIQQALKEGQQLIVQVEKEERGNKGAALTTQVSLAGRYLVLMPRTEGSGGISRKVESRDRDELRDTMNGVEIPPDMSAIARTMALGRSQEELQWDLNYLQDLWNSIVQATESRPAPFLVYQESNIVSRTIRDHLRGDVSDIIIDDPAVYAEAVEFMQQLMPHNLDKLKLYEDSIPLFTRYQIENQIETAHQRSVNLRSGGSIVIDHTEALTSIDINSARATQGSDIEETAFRTNMEAAEEVARQLRLRDLGGLLVIDFIDMNSNRNQREVETCLRDATKADRARIQIGKISRFGLLEMSRQRLGASLREISAINCPRCDGQGTIRTVESLALHILRLIEDEAHKERTARISVQVPVAVATFLFNEKRDILADLDKRLGMHALILPNPSLETPHYDIQRTRVQDLNKTLVDTASFDLPVIDDEEPAEQSRSTPPERPVVTPVARTAPPPRTEIKEKGLLARMFGWLGGEAKPEPAKNKRQSGNSRNGKRPNRDRDSRSRNQDNRNNSKRNDSRRSSGNRQDSSDNRQASNRNSQGGQNKSGDQRGPQQSTNSNADQRDASKTSGRRGGKGNRGNRGGKSNRRTENDNRPEMENQPSQANTSPASTPNRPADNDPAEKSPVAESKLPANEQPAVINSDTPKPAQQGDRVTATAAEQGNNSSSAATQAQVSPSAAGAEGSENPAQKNTSTSADKVADAPPPSAPKQTAPRVEASTPGAQQPAVQADKAPVKQSPAAATASTSQPAPKPAPAESTAPPVNTPAPVAAAPKPAPKQAPRPAPAAASAPSTRPVEPESNNKTSSDAASSPQKPVSSSVTESKPQPTAQPSPAKKLAGQIETQATDNAAHPAPSPVAKAPAPRPTQWTQPNEKPATGKQIETRKEP